MANEFKIKKGLIVTGADGGTVVDIQGSQGQLFSVTDDLSGSIFAVSDISGVPILDVNSSGLSTFDGDVNLPDSKKILLGTGNDFQLYHDGTHGVLNNTTGNLYTSALGALMFRTSLNVTALTLDASQNATFAGTVTSPTFLGDLNGTINTATTGVTQTAGDDSTKIATTAYADAAAAAVPIGNYLPLSAGSGSPLTGALHFGDAFNYIEKNASSDMLMVANRHITFSDVISGVVNERMRIEEGGNVGIGTTSPQQKIQVASPSSTSVVLGASYLSTNNNNFFEVGILANDGYLNLRNSGVQTTVHIDSDGNSFFNGGNVGIGTTSPGTKLTVDAGSNIASFRSVGSGQNNKELLIQTGGDRVILDAKNADDGTATALAFESGSSESMRISSDGNVGIGTTSPNANAKLHLYNSASATDVALRLTSNADSKTLIGFGDTVDQTAGAIKYDNATSEMSFEVLNSTEAMRISSAGAIKFNNYNSTNKTGTPTYLLGTDASGNIVKTNTVPGSGAGPYLPLSAGSGSSLTDNLYINDVDQNNVNRYGNLQSEVGFSRSPIAGNPNQWFKVVEMGGSPKRVKLSIISTGDNTNSYDNFLISTSGYGMNMHIQKLPGGRYNTSKLLAVSAVNPSNGGGVEIWIKLLPVSSGTGTTYVACTSDVLASATILASATTTDPYTGGNDTQLYIGGDNRNHATIQTSRGATFGNKVGIGTNTPAAMLTVSGDTTITGNVGIGTTSPSEKLDVNGNIQGNNIYVNDSSVPSLYMERGDSSLQPVIRLVKSNDNLLIGHTAIDEVIFYDDAGEAMRLDGSGNLGIGTTSPGYPLEVIGKSASSDGFHKTGSQGVMLSAGSGIDTAVISNGWTSGVGDWMRLEVPSADDENGLIQLNSNGNVGIGTTSPGYTLDVNGSIHSTNITIADAIYHEGDTNNYMQFHAADQWRVVTGGTERLEVNNSLSTFTTPVLIQTTGGGMLTLKDTNSTGDAATPYINFVDSAGTRQGYVGIGSGGSAKLYLEGLDGIQTNNPLAVSGNLSTSGDLTVSGGDISLGGTGRIQGVDTVSASTDAANKAYVDNRVATLGQSFTRSGINSSTYTMLCTVAGDNLASVIEMTITGTSGNVVIASSFEIICNHSTDIHVRSMSGDYTNVTIKITSNNNEDYSIEAKHNGSTTTEVEVFVFPRAGETITPTTTDPGYTGAEYEHTASEGWRFGGEDGGAESSNVIVDGKVGIGTTSPNTALEVDGAISTTTSDYAQGSTGSRLLLETSGSGNTHSYIQAQSSGGTSNAEDLALQLYGGNVGIGTSSPLRKLHVVGNFAVNAGTGEYYGVNITGGEGANPNILIGDWHNSSANIKWDSSGNYLRIDAQHSTSGAPIVFSGNDSAIEYMRITSSGNVGIGTTSPVEKLDVVGNIKLSGTQYVSKSSSANITPVAGDWIDIAYMPYGEHHGMIALEWNGIAAPSCCHHGWAQFSVGTYYSSSFNYGQDTYVELVKAHAHNDLWLEAVRAVDVGSYVTIQVKFSRTVVSGSFVSYVLSQGQGTITPYQPYVNNNSYTVLANANVGKIDGEEVQKAFANPVRFSGKTSFDDNVGIGTTSPNSKLHVSGGDIELDDGYEVKFDVSGTVTAGEELILDAGNTDSKIILDGADSAMKFITGNSTAIAINDAQNVGIGTTSPANKLDVVGISRFTHSSSTAYRGAIETVTDNAYPTWDIGWLHARTGSSTYGNIARFNDQNGSQIGGIFYSGSSGTSFVTTSDYRLKENIKEISDSISRVKKLKPCRFNFAAEKNRVIDGFIAHEVQEVVPEAVHGEKDALQEDGSINAQTLEVSRLIPVLTKALQEAIDKIEELESRIQTLENK